MRILIDNGHGIGTAGKRSPYAAHKVKPALGLYEWRWTREIATRLYAALRSIGYDAELLVTEDRDVSLLERCHRVNVRCNSLGKDNVLLVSIHGNALGGGEAWYSAKGWCCYTSVGQTRSDILAEYLYDAAEKNFPGRQIRRETVDGDSDFESNFAVLAKTFCAAVLTENFFYTNVEDCRFMLSEAGKDAIVRCHVDGIVRYCNSIAPAVVKP